MIVPLLILAVSLAGIGLAVVLPDFEDVLLLVVPSALVALFLLLRAILQRAGRFSVVSRP